MLHPAPPFAIEFLNPVPDNVCHWYGDDQRQQRSRAPFHIERADGLRSIIAHGLPPPFLRNEKEQMINDALHQGEKQKRRQEGGKEFRYPFDHAEWIQLLAIGFFFHKAEASGAFRSAFTQHLGENLG